VNIEQIADIVEVLLEPALLVSTDGTLLALNQYACELMQCDAGAVLGRPLAERVRESAAQVDAYISACLSTDQAMFGCLSLNDCDQALPCLCYGQKLCFADTAAVLIRCTHEVSFQSDFRAGGEHLFALFQAMTHRRLLDARLRASEAQAAAVLNTVVEAIITVDSRGIIQTFNPAAERMFGYRAWEMIGHNINLLMPSPYREQHDVFIKDYLKTGEKKIIGIGREIIARRKDGTVFPIELAVSEVRVDGQYHFTGVIRDISERKLAEQRLREQELETQQTRERLAHVNRIDTLGEMAAGIAHEVNQPLAAIASYARACGRWLEAGRYDHPQLLETLNEINEQAQHAGDIIHGLRKLIKKRASTRERCELQQLILETARLCHLDAHQHGIRIVTRLPDTKLFVVVDPVQIQQVVLNLMRNAIDATLEAGTGESATDTAAITVSACEQDGFARVQVSDEGPGLDSAARENLFDPFFTTKLSGMGMGLSICRSIIQAHHGRIGFDANALRGATLFFSIPLALE
jgi:two-component system sensor kinase FixL